MTGGLWALTDFLAPSLSPDKLCRFLEAIHSFGRKAQLALDQWGDYDLTLNSVMAFLGEGQGATIQTVLVGQHLPWCSTQIWSDA